MEELITISIVAYHNYSNIKNAIDTIEKFTEKSIKKRILVIDNSSIESNTNDVNEFKEYLKKYNDVDYIKTKKNLGFGKGHNYILNNIHSKYHAIVNPDILLIEDSFSKIINYFEENLNIGMIIPKIIDEEGNIQKVYRKEVTIKDMFIRFFCPKLFPKKMDEITLQDMDYSKVFDLPFGQGSFLVIRTELFKELNGFDDKFFMYLEDADLCKRVNQISKLIYFPETKVIHLWEKGSHKNFKLFCYHLKSMFIYFKKWGIK